MLARLLRILIVFSLFAVAGGGLAARPWGDLDEGEHSIYGKEREEKLPIRMFFIQKEQWEDHESLHIFWLFAYTNYPRYQSRRFLPFYYNLSSRLDNRNLFLSPVYYRQIDGGERDESLLWLYYWGSDELDASKYSLLFPLYYHSSQSDQKRFFISPLFFYSRRSDQKAGSDSDVTLGIPLIPVILWRSGEQKRDLIFFYFFRHRSLADSTLSHTLPLYYYDAAKDGSRSFFLSPVYMNDTNGGARDSALLWLYYAGHDDKTGKSYSSLLPFYFRSKRGDEVSLFLTPLFLYSHQPPPADPAVPDARGSSFFLSPVYMHDLDGTRRSSALLWLFYWGGDTSIGKTYSSLFPLYYRSASEYEKFFLTPLFYYSHKSEIVIPWKDERVSSFFLSPLYMRSVDDKGSDASLLWLYYWGSDVKSEKKYSLLFPVYYYSKSGAGDSFLLTPLFRYSRKSDAKDPAKSETTFGIPALPIFSWTSASHESDFNLLYVVRHRRRQNELLSYALPFYYYSREGDKSLASYLIPLIWVSSDAEKSTWFILPLFYSAQAKNGTTKLSPVYIALTSERSNFHLFIPLYLNYETKDYSFHLNLSGISLSEEKLSHFPVSAQISREKILVDWDFGWFYNLFRVSSRDTVRLVTPPPQPPPAPLPVAAEKKAQAKGAKKKVETKPATPAPAPAEDKAQILRKRERTRADSENFFGLYFLFGASAYERADHYRHFRLLPLSWLTWNAQSKQGVQTIIPFYVNYQDEDSRYTVFFPFYGVQQKFYRPIPLSPDATPACTSEISSWLVIAYWSEFDCETEMSEKTVLWPIYNRYGSPQRGGFRIFPVFWSKWRLEGGREKALHFSPLHVTTIEGENFDTYSWLFYRSRTASKGSWGIWALAHLSRAHDGSESTTYILPFYHHRIDQRPAADGPKGAPPPYNTLFTFAGVFWRISEVYDDGGFTGHFSPLYVYLGEKNRHSYFYSWIYYQTDSGYASSFGIPFVLHRKHLKDDSYANFFLMPFYHSREKINETDTEKTTWLLPLFYNRTSPASDTLVLPLFFRYANRFVNVSAATGKPEISTEYDLGHISPLYIYSEQNNSVSFYSWIFYHTHTERTTSAGVPLLFHRKAFKDGSYANFYIPLLYRSYERLPNGGEENVTLLLPVFYIRNGTDSAFHLSPFYTYSRHGGSSSFYSWLFYRFHSEQETSNGIPLLFHRKTKADGSYANFYLPLFYHSRESLPAAVGGEDRITLLFPLWYSRSTEKSYTRLVLGYYHESSNGYRKDMLPLIFGRTYNEIEDTYSWNALLYAFIYERQKRQKEFSLLYGLGFNYADEEQVFSWHLALFTGYKHYSSTGFVRHHFLPLWWHSHQAGESDTYLPFLLAAFKNHDNGNRVFRAVLLGILFYQNSDFKAYDQTMAVALGALYYHNKSPERRFDSYGSLYGLLWHYETEENYKRFSLLTFIYTRTETEKGTRHRLLGIPLN